MTGASGGIGTVRALPTLLNLNILSLTRTVYQFHLFFDNLLSGFISPEISIQLHLLLRT